MTPTQSQINERFHPSDPDGALLDYIQFGAWSGLLEWLLSQADAMAAFEAHTGIKKPAPRAGIEAMIDKACGHDPTRDFLRVFVPWATSTYWGDDEVTPSIRAVIDRVAAA
jgi:hypothetical protein